MSTSHEVWALMILGGIGSALAALALGRVRARDVEVVTAFRAAET